MLKRFGSIIYCLCLMLALVGCSEKYSEEDIIGKTSDEIVSTYGEFDNVIGIDVSEENDYFTFILMKMELQLIVKRVLDQAADSKYNQNFVSTLMQRHNL